MDAPEPHLLLTPEDWDVARWLESGAGARQRVGWPDPFELGEPVASFRRSVRTPTLRRLAGFASRLAPLLDNGQLGRTELTGLWIGPEDDMPREGRHVLSRIVRRHIQETGQDVITSMLLGTTMPAHHYAAVPQPLKVWASHALWIGTALDLVHSHERSAKEGMEELNQRLLNEAAKFVDEQQRSNPAVRFEIRLDTRDDGLSIDDRGVGLPSTLVTSSLDAHLSDARAHLGRAITEQHVKAGLTELDL